MFHVLRFSGSAGAVGKKIAIDQLLYAPVLTCVLYSFLCVAHLDLAGIPAELQVRFPDCGGGNSTMYCMWPATLVLWGVPPAIWRSQQVFLLL